MRKSPIILLEVLEGFESVEEKKSVKSIIAFLNAALIPYHTQSQRENENLKKSILMSTHI